MLTRPLLRVGRGIGSFKRDVSPHLASPGLHDALTPPPGNQVGLRWMRASCPAPLAATQCGRCSRSTRRRRSSPPPSRRRTGASSGPSATCRCALTAGPRVPPPFRHAHRRRGPLHPPRFLSPRGTSQEKVDSITAGLLEANFSRGDSIVFWSDQGFYQAAFQLACAQIGITIWCADPSNDNPGALTSVLGRRARLASGRLTQGCAQGAAGPIAGAGPVFRRLLQGPGPVLVHAVPRPRAQPK